MGASDPCLGGVTCMTKCIDGAGSCRSAGHLFAIALPAVLLPDCCSYVKSKCLDSWFEKTVRVCSTVWSPWHGGWHAPWRADGGQNTRWFLQRHIRCHPWKVDTGAVGPRRPDDGAAGGRLRALGAGLPRAEKQSVWKQKSLLLMGSRHFVPCGLIWWVLSDSNTRPTD